MTSNLAAGGFNITGVGAANTNLEDYITSTNADLVNVLSTVSGVETQWQGTIETTGKIISGAGMSISGLSNDITGTLSIFSNTLLFSKQFYGYRKL